MQPETKYAQSGDIYIAYQVSGNGPTDVIWVPGTFSHLDLDWEHPLKANFIERFSSFCRLIRFDKRGTGLSDRPLQMATLEERADDIRAVMDAEHIQSATIFGASEGGSMACLFAATYPERTRSLMTWGSQARWIKTDDYPWGLTPEENEQMLAEIRKEWPSKYYLFGPGAGYNKDIDPATLDFYVRYMRAGGSPSAVIAYEEMNAQSDIREILPTIHVPALIMNRTGDPVAQVDAGRDMAAHIPGARFIEFAGDTHAIFSLGSEKILAEIEEFITGTRSVVEADRVLATVLFLDIVSSTERAVALGDAGWHTVLDGYYATVRKELARFRGKEVDTAGDGFFATFDGPARAIRCACAIRQAVKALGLEVRSGLHTGECELIGEKVGGIAVHIGARVMSKAGAGEVLVSSTIKDLVAGSGIRFEDRGAQLLKGIPGEWRLSAVSAV